MGVIQGHFAPTLPEWTPSTAIAAPVYWQPTPPNGFVYLASATPGTTGATQPVWPTAHGASVNDNGLTWTNEGSAAQFQLQIWDQKQSQCINGDLGGSWAPATPIVLQYAGGTGQYLLHGPAVVSDNATLTLESGAALLLDIGDYPRLSPDHQGQLRRIKTTAMVGVAEQPIGVRADFALHGLRAVACGLTLYSVAAPSGGATFGEAVVVATTNLTLANEQLIDGIHTSSSRVLVAGQTAAEDNGIYVTASGTWARATDANAGALFTTGKVVPVQSGTYQGKAWAYAGTPNPTIGTTPIAFAFSTDALVTTESVPIQFAIPLRVHNGATLQQAVLSYRSFLGTPRARLIATAGDGTVVPLTSVSAGADANGWVAAPALTSAPVQSWTIPIDGGEAPANAVAAIDENSYFLQVIEDQSQVTTGYPYALPVLAPVFVATTGNVDLANAPQVIDGMGIGLLVPGVRVLVKDQDDPTQNGIYIYPGEGNPFEYVAATPVPAWNTSTSYSLGQLVQSIPPNGLFYEATGAGNSGGMQPAWPTTTGVTVGDNSVTWTCRGPLALGIYVQAVEVRTYGLAQGTVVVVENGAQGGNTLWQYSGASIVAAAVGKLPALPWGTLPTGFLPNSTTDVPQTGVGIFAAQGNVYHGVAVDHFGITSEQFQ